MAQARSGYRAEVLTDTGWALSDSVYATATAVGLSLAAALFIGDLITIGTVRCAKGTSRLRVWNPH